MGINVVVQWSVPDGREAEVDAALRVISDHARDEHPGIQACRVFRQFAGGEAHRAYWWLEEYESFSAFEREVITEECDRVWQPIRDLEIPGTRRQLIWTDTGKNAWFTR